MKTLLFAALALLSAPAMAFDPPAIPDSLCDREPTLEALEDEDGLTFKHVTIDITQADTKKSIATFEANVPVVAHNTFWGSKTHKSAYIASIENDGKTTKLYPATFCEGVVVEGRINAENKGIMVVSMRMLDKAEPNATGPIHLGRYDVAGREASLAFDTNTTVEQGGYIYTISVK